MEPRISLITLEVADVPRSRRFYERMGFRAAGVGGDEVAFFQAGCMALAVWSRTSLAADTTYDGYAGYFADPDGHAWEIAWNPGFPLGPGGELRLPS